NQVRGFVVCAGRSVSEEKARGVELRDGVAQPVADGREFLREVAHSRGREQQAFEYATIQRRERLEVCDRDALVDLVNRRVDRSELDHFGTHVGDEAPVGGSASARYFRPDATDFLRDFGGDAHELAPWGEIRPT